MSMVDAIFGGIALALWAAVWAMSPRVGDKRRDSKVHPLGRTPARKGGAR